MSTQSSPTQPTLQLHIGGEGKQPGGEAKQPKIIKKVGQKIFFNLCEWLKNEANIAQRPNVPASDLAVEAAAAFKVPVSSRTVINALDATGIRPIERKGPKGPSASPDANAQAQHIAVLATSLKKLHEALGHPVPEELRRLAGDE